VYSSYGYINLLNRPHVCSAMKLLIDILHPAHLHRLKYFIRMLKDAGHEVVITARNKEVVFRLLNTYGFSYVDTGKLGKGNKGRIEEYFRRMLIMFRVARKFKPDVLIGGDGVTIGPVGKLLRIPSVSVSDTEDAGLISKISYPVTTHIVTPYCFERDFGEKQIRFHGFFELAYLSDKYFVHDPSVLKEFGITEGEAYFILRFVSWDACHDVDEKGLSLDEKRQIFKELSQHGKVFISSDGKVPAEFAPYAIDPVNMHSVLYYSSLYVGDSQTMSIEAGLLGVPSIRCNSLVGKMHARGQFLEFQRYGLVYSYSDFASAFAKMKEILAMKNAKQEWEKKRQIIIKETIDFNTFFFDWIQQEKFKK